MITLDSGCYRIGEFAKAAHVSLRTLRYYDKLGLLRPSVRSSAGYRIYTEADLLILQQILTLRFLGLSLDEIRTCLQSGTGRIGAIFAQQRAVMQDRRRQIDVIICALERAQALVERGRCDWHEVSRVIEAIQMELQKDWVKKHFSEESLKTMDELSRSSYSEEARAKLAQRTWTEADQERATARWAYVAAESKRLAELGADPAGEEAQAIAKLKSDLLFEFTQGDPDITAGLGKFWQSHNALPESQQPLRPAVPSEVIPGSQDAAAHLLTRAMEIYKQSGKG